MKGDWIQTYTGRQFWPLEPKEDQIDIIDIAHALSLICRFTGHCRQFYSVAEHSLRVAHILPDDLKIYGLLHDASEAYICDIARPLKHLRAFNNYRKIEKNIMKVICKKFGLSFNKLEEVKAADITLLSTEYRDLITHKNNKWKGLLNPLKSTIVPMSTDLARKLFLQTFAILTSKQ